MTPPTISKTEPTNVVDDVVSAAPSATALDTIVAGSRIPAQLLSEGSSLDRWRQRNRYYWKKKVEYLRFVVPEGESVLLFGCEDGAMLDALAPSHGVGVDASPGLVALAGSRFPHFRFVHEADFATKLDGTFSYIVLNDVGGTIEDLFRFLQQLVPLCRADTRVVVLQHNYLWRPVFRLAEWLRLKRPTPTQNWLSAGDIETFLVGAGFEPREVRHKLHCPRSVFGLGTLWNAAMSVMPFVNRLASTEIIIAKRETLPAPPETKSATVVLTTRDERDNIEPILRAIPDIGSSTEILFVEGHSTDGTREEIERVIEAYPHRDIRLLVQDGIGQGDAIRKGFSEARGDVIILLEADQTSPPEDVCKAFDIVATGRAEFVNGTRFVYPRDPGAMPLPNVVGNWAFALWFTWFLGQRTSDVLCGIKAIDRRQFHRLNKNWGFLGLFDPFGDFELAFGAARLSLKTCEVPTRYSCRSYGEPKSRVFRHGLMLLRMAWRATAVFKCR